MMLDLLEHDSVVYLGNVARNDVLALTNGASLCVNLCPDEGLPRSSLEALALNRPTLLPPNIPEFEKYCGDWVIASTDPESVGNRIIAELSAPQAPKYPVKNHDLGAIRDRYLATLHPNSDEKAAECR